jgi:hypothetical protein
VFFVYVEQYELQRLTNETRVREVALSMTKSRVSLGKRCLLPVNNLSLGPEYFGERLGRGYVRVPCKACGVQYDRREIEEHSHPHAPG